MKKEYISIILAMIIFSFAVAFKAILTKQGIPTIVLFSLAAIVAITISIFSKKLAAYYFEIKIEHKIWQWERYGLRKNQHLEKQLSMGILAPFVIALVSFGNFIIGTLLEFEAESLTSRVSKRHDIFKFTELTEIHLGLIAAAGVFANLLFAVIAYILGIQEFAKISIYFAFWSIVPFSNLDGAKIFFGNRTLWAITSTITIIFLLYAIFLP